MKKCFTIISLLSILSFMLKIYTRIRIYIIVYTYTVHIYSFFSIKKKRKEKKLFYIDSLEKPSQSEPDSQQKQLASIRSEKSGYPGRCQTLHRMQDYQKSKVGDYCLGSPNI